MLVVAVAIVTAFAVALAAVVAAVMRCWYCLVRAALSHDRNLHPRIQSLIPGHDTLNRSPRVSGMSSRLQSLLHQGTFITNWIGFLLGFRV